MGYNIYYINPAIKSDMLQPTEIKVFLVFNIPNHPRDIVAFAAKSLNVTRTTIHRHMNALIKQQKVSRTGTTKQTNYYLTNQRNRTYTFTMNSKLKEDIVWNEDLKPQLIGVNNNIRDIIQYGFTEIFNNVLDHAFATNIIVSINWEGEMIRLAVEDNGVGVFERLNRVFHYKDNRETLLQLSKGKLTTDPVNHTGEGLFFTSRVFDYFYLTANGLCFFRNNKELDWAVESVPLKKGTQVLMEISQNSTRRTTEIFSKYTENFEFSKTDLLVDLSQFAGERLISRSQAKRLFTEIEPFTSVTLDFAKVAIVGQGFVDEVFRVYPAKNKNIKINYINANDDVTFMIKRSLP